MNQITKDRPLRITMWIAALLVLFAGLAQLPAIWNRFVPPYVVEYAEAQNPILGPGQQLFIVYRMERRRLCRTDVDRFIRAVPGGAVVWRDRVPGGAHGIGKHHIVSPLRIPTDIPEGEYILFSTILSDCTEGMHTAEVPPVQFWVRN